MAFGDNYAPVETIPPLEDGEYKARIKKVELATYRNGNEYCKVEVEISGHKGCLPNTIILNETPALGSYKGDGTTVTEKDVNISNQIQTRFFDAFGIPRNNFNIATWKGKIGFVRCSPQKNKPEYKQLTPIVKKDEKPQTNAVETVKNALPVESVQVQQKQPTGDLNNFPDEVPF